MRPPFTSDALENKPATNSAVSRDPSYPDRARIDSDVRAFLRPVSTPWIVFDRDSRVDDFAKSALRVGAVFASSPSFRPEVIQAAAESGKSGEEIAAQPLPGLAAPESVIVREPFQPGALLAPAMSSVLPDAGTFPSSTSAPESTCQSAGEPSNVVVAADVFPDSASAIALASARRSLASDPFASPPALVARRGRIAAIAGACAGVLALVGVSAIVLAGGGRAPAKAASAAQAVQVSAVAAAIATPVSAETAARDEVPAPPIATAQATTTREPAAAKAPTDPKKRFGKLTIKGEARRKNVWFDGKRMLGSGQRSFTVFCGMHTIAVSDKSDAKDVEVPCNGEYVVSK